MPGRMNSLAQTLLKLTAPGVPDIYQGGELWDLRLVDPDNRVPVDYASAARDAGLSLKAGRSVEEIMSRMDGGLPKMWVTHRSLELRQSRPEWFGENAAYTPIEATGAKAEHVHCVSARARMC